MKIRSKALCLATTLVVGAWIITASPVDATVDSTGRPAGGAVSIDSAHGPGVDDVTELATVGAAPGTALRTVLLDSYRRIAATRVHLRPRPASGNVGPRGPPSVL